MLTLTLAEIARACGGIVQRGDPETSVSAITIDSRAVRPGDLFVGLRGDRFDGDAYAAAAAAAGAAAVVVRAETLTGLPAQTAAVVVEDGLPALQGLAGHVRTRSRVRVVGITGSTGKTSTKDILASLLVPVTTVVATRANFNNEVGLPLTLLGIDEQTQVEVCELAMRGAGQIRELARIAAPDVGIITAVAPVHIELVGSLAGVAAAKAELIEELGSGTAIVPHAEPLLDGHLAAHDGRTVTFGEGGDVRFAETRPERGGTQALVDAFGHRASLWFNFSGAHYLTDALAALAAFMELGHPIEAARQGAGAVVFSAGRGEIVDLQGGGLLLNDTYNASPVAVRAALDHLVSLAAGRPALAILGDMLELGPQAAAYHREVGDYAASLGVPVAAVGELAQSYLCGAPGERSFATVQECVAALPRLVAPGSAVLVKASRGMRLERVAEAIRRELGAARAGEAGAAARDGSVSEPTAPPAGPATAPGASPAPVDAPDPPRTDLGGPA